MKKKQTHRQSEPRRSLACLFLFWIICKQFKRNKRTWIEQKRKHLAISSSLWELVGYSMNESLFHHSFRYTRVNGVCSDCGQFLFFFFFFQQFITQESNLTQCLMTFWHLLLNGLLTNWAAFQSNTKVYDLAPPTPPKKEKKEKLERLRQICNIISGHWTHQPQKCDFQYNTMSVKQRVLA